MVNPTFWAIKHKPSNSFLPPAHGTRQGRGFTAVEPSEHLPPRLFTLESAAKCALKWYLKGETTTKVHRFEDTWNGGYEYEETWHTEDKGRKKEDYEVVSVIVVPVLGVPERDAKKKAPIKPRN